jgi:hypothetical protein
VHLDQDQLLLEIPAERDDGRAALAEPVVVDALLLVERDAPVLVLRVEEVEARAVELELELGVEQALLARVEREREVRGECLFDGRPALVVVGLGGGQLRVLGEKGLPRASPAKRRHTHTHTRTHTPYSPGSSLPST